MKRPAVFFDRDNTLIVSDGYLGDPDAVVLVPSAAEAVAKVRAMGFAVVVFSNQSGVARGMFTEEDVHRVNARLDELLRDHDAGAVIDRHEFCPHHPDAAVPRYRQASEFRKPAPGMIYQAARQLGLDLGRSWVVGDAPRDIEAGRAAGCRTILFKDPSLPPSSAAKAAATVEPDFMAATLMEAAEIIERNAAPEPAEEAAGETGSAAAAEAGKEAESGLERPGVGVEGQIEVPAQAGALESTATPHGPIVDVEVLDVEVSEVEVIDVELPDVVPADATTAEVEVPEAQATEPQATVDRSEAEPRPEVAPAGEPPHVHEPEGAGAAEPAPEREPLVGAGHAPGPEVAAVSATVEEPRPIDEPDEALVPLGLETPGTTEAGRTVETTAEPTAPVGIPVTLVEAPAAAPEGAAELAAREGNRTAEAGEPVVAVEAGAVETAAAAESVPGAVEPAAAPAPEVESASGTVMEPTSESAVTVATAEPSTGEAEAQPVAAAELMESEQRPEMPTPAAERNAELAAEEPVPEEPASVDPPAEPEFEATRRRSPPAVILAAKAAREAARNSRPDASPEALREAARQAAREAAMGLTGAAGSAGPAGSATLDSAETGADAPSESSEVAPEPEPETTAVAESAPIPVIAAEEPRAGVEPAPAERPRVAALPLDYRSPGDASRAGGGQRRLEELAEQILQELKNRNEAAADFSVSKLMAGITMVISLAVLACAYLYKDSPQTLQSFLLLGILLQALTISLLIMGRQR